MTTTAMPVKTGYTSQLKIIVKYPNEEYFRAHKMLIYPKILQDHGLVAAQSQRYIKDKNDKDFSSDRQLFLSEAGLKAEQIASSKQVHDNKVLVTDKAIYAEGYDAIVTNTPGVFACVTVADCTPVLIYDKKNKAVAAIHAGWRGTVARIVEEALNEMKNNYGTKGEDCLVYIGACISEQNFEVGEEVAEYFSADEKYFHSGKKKFFVNLKLANKKQLMALGVLEKNIEISEFCTIADNDKFYSYRKEEGKTGRLFAVIGMKV